MRAGAARLLGQTGYGLQWYAAEDYALAHPIDPDVPELLERVRHEKHDYLRWGRDSLGWALYLFGK